MHNSVLKAVHIILISVGLALVFNSLFYDTVPGISVLIFVATLLGTVFWFGLHHPLPLRKTWWLLTLIAFFALMPSIRANGFLTFLNICTTLGLLLLLAHELAGTPTVLLKLRDYLFLITLVPLRMLGRALSTVTLLGQIQSEVEHRDVWLRALKGAIVALPILIIFGMLFAQADLAFSQFITGFIDITISDYWIGYCVMLVFAFIAVSSFLSYIFFPQNPSVSSSKQPTVAVQPGRGIEVMVFLGLIAALFLLFIGFQITYLFGGETNIIEAGFTYAEYARRGFWELLAVALLSLVVLLASEKYAGSELTKNRRFLITALFLIAEVAVVIVSAFKRLSLYIDAYGMTMLRLYVAGFITLVLVLFILLAIKFITSKREEFFAFGTLLAMATFVIAMNVINPDAFILAFNMEQYRQTGKIDVSYARELSVDALPEKLELYQQLTGEDKIILRNVLHEKKERLIRSNVDWQSANLSRTRGLKLLQDF